jgi:hypothetical protein
MGRGNVCAVCSSPIRAEVDAALEAGSTQRSILAKTPFSRAGLSRHARNCIQRTKMESYLRKVRTASNVAMWTTVCDMYTGERSDTAIKSWGPPRADGMAENYTITRRCERSRNRKTRKDYFGATTNCRLILPGKPYSTWKPSPETSQRFPNQVLAKIGTGTTIEIGTGTLKIMRTARSRPNPRAGLCLGIV